MLLNNTLKNINLSQNLVITIQVVLIISLTCFCIVIPDFPNYPCWDEPYYISTTYRYLSNIFFLYPHFPLGLLILYFSSFIFGAKPNPELAENFIASSNIPVDFDYMPMRILTIGISCLIPISIYFVTIKITKSKTLALVLSFFEIFDNSQIAMFRMAVLDHIILFLEIWILYINSIIFKLKNFNPFLNIIYGVIFGLFLCTKLNSFTFFVLLFPYSLTKVSSIKNYLYILVPLIRSHLSVWNIHFSIAINYNEKISNELINTPYNLSINQIQWIKEHTVLQPFHLISFIFTYIKYGLDLHANHVSKYDITDIVSSASNPLNWLLGGTDVVFKYGYVTINNITKFLVLAMQCNIFIYIMIAVVIYCVFHAVINKFLFNISTRITTDIELRYILITYVIYYSCFLFSPRVVYLYHYFPLIILSYFIICRLYVIYYDKVLKLNKIYLDITMYNIIIISAIVFLYYAPYTYGFYQPYSYFKNSEIFQFWKITPHLKPMLLESIKSITLPSIVYLDHDEIPVTTVLSGEIPKLSTGKSFVAAYSDSTINFNPTDLFYKINLVAVKNNLVVYLKDIPICIESHCPEYNIKDIPFDFIYYFPSNFINKYNLKLESFIPTNLTKTY